MRHSEPLQGEQARQIGLVQRSLGALLRRYAARNERLRLCETLSLGGRRSVALIEVDGKQFLAGLSASGVDMLIAVDGAGAKGGLR